MRTGIRKKVLLSIAIVSIALFAGVWNGFVRNSFTLTGVSDAVYHENSLYVIDNDGTTYNFLHLATDGTINGLVSVPKLSGSRWNTYSHLNVDQDGQVYVYGYSRSMEENIIESTVYLCDFERGRLVPVWQLSDIRAIQCQVFDGSLYYGEPPDEGTGTGFYKVDKAGQKSRIFQTEFSYDKMVTVYYEEGQGIFWSDYNGRLYKNGREIKNDTLSKDEDEIEKNERAHICMDHARIVYTDTNTQTVNAVAMDTEEKSVLFSTAGMNLETDALEYKDVIPFHYGGGVFTAAVDVTGTIRAAGLFSEDGTLVTIMQSIRYSVTEQWENGLKGFAVMLLAELSVLFAAVFFLKGMKGMVPILTKVFICVLPLLLLGAVLLGTRLLKAFENHSLKMEYDLLYALADKELSRIDPKVLKSVNLEKIPDDSYYQKVFGGKDYSVLPARLYTSEPGEDDPVTANTYQWVYIKKENGQWEENEIKDSNAQGNSGVLKYMVVDDNYYGARVDYYRDRGQMELMEKAMKEKKVIKTQYNDQEGNWIALYVPILDEYGESIGIMESGMSYGNLLYESRQQTKKIIGPVAAAMGLLAIILAVLLSVSLHPLGRLRRAVEEMADGKLGVMVEVRGRDEVSGISGAFNNMSGKIGEQVDFISKCLGGYEKFVPKRLFDILGREDITQVELGDHKKIFASVLSVGSSYFSGMAKNMSGEEIYGLLNRIMEELLPIVGNDGGVVDHMAEAGFLAFYPDCAESGLRTAISVCEKINLLSGQGEVFPPFGIAVTYGEVRVGIVGQEMRVSATTIAECVTLSEYLKGIGVVYGARVLITGTAAGRIPEFLTRYHTRMIGYLKMELSDCVETLYDVYDGDCAEERRKKEDTKEIFKEGVQAFSEQRFYDARQKFAQVLRVNRDDKAAGSYVYRCDTYYREKDQSGLDIYLEHY